MIQQISLDLKSIVENSGSSQKLSTNQGLRNFFGSHDSNYFLVIVILCREYFDTSLADWFGALIIFKDVSLHEKTFRPLSVIREILFRLLFFFVLSRYQRE